MLFCFIAHKRAPLAGVCLHQQVITYIVEMGSAVSTASKMSSSSGLTDVSKQTSQHHRHDYGTILCELH